MSPFTLKSVCLFLVIVTIMFCCAPVQGVNRHHTPSHSSSPSHSSPSLSPSSVSPAVPPHPAFSSSSSKQSVSKQGTQGEQGQEHTHSFVQAISSSSVRRAGCERPLEAKPETITIDADLVEKAANWTKEPYSGGCNHSKNKGLNLYNHAMPDDLLHDMVEAAWKAFGAEGDNLTSFTDDNLKQIQRESGGCPNRLQGQIGDVNDDNPAGGLFQFIKVTFNQFAVVGYPVNRFNPLSNILAAVNAQANAHCVTTNCGKRILNGCSGWNPSPMKKADNPYYVEGSTP